jgi:HEPN domain-containing protein
MQKHNAWLDLATSDLRLAQKLTKEGEFVGQAMFLAQQCAEKSLKAYLAYKREPIRRIHDLVTLVNMCKRIDADFSSILMEAADLNPYLCRTRYPDDCYLMPDLTTLKISVQQAQKIYDFVVNKMYVKK